jgi:hypothetical protein
VTAEPLPTERPLLSLVPKQSSLDHFLTDGEIGPLTGISVLFARTGLFRQIGELPAELQQKSYFCYANTCIVRGEYDTLDDLFDTYPQFWDENRIRQMFFERMGYTPQGQRLDEAQNPHKIKVLEEDYAGLRNRRKDLIARLETDAHAIDPSLLARFSAAAQEETQRASHSVEYDLRRNLFGIELAYARLGKAMTQAAKLERMEELGQRGHTQGVIRYLRERTSDGKTGLDVIKKRIKFNGINPVGWKVWVGTPKHPGRILHPVMAIAGETFFNLAGGAVAGVALYAGKEALQSYSPDTLAYIQSITGR